MKVLTYKEVAAQLGLPMGTVYALVSQRRIPHHRLGPRLVRFDEGEIRKWWSRLYSVKIYPQRTTGCG